MKVDTGVKCGEMTLQTPLLTGSGTFGYGDEFQTVMDYSAFGGIVTKSLSYEPRPGNLPPRICETPGGGVINSIGLANPGIEEFLKTKVKILPVEKTKVFLSVVGDSVEDFINVVVRLEDVKKIAGYELNVSCPNVKKGGLDIGGDQEAVTNIVHEVRSITKRFISVKLTPHHPQIQPLAIAAENSGADALTLTNTLVGMSIDLDKRKPLLGNVTGGYSGVPLKPVALAKVWQAAQVVSIPIWASGGMVSGRDCLEFIVAGATCLQIGSVLFADPYAPHRILKEMIDWCELNDVSSLSELIGTLQIQ